MLIHGARAALAGRSRGDTPLGARQTHPALTPAAALA